MKQKNSLLVLIDGSDRALDAVRYVASIEAFRPLRVVLMSIYTAVPESYLDLERQPECPEEVAQINTWQMRQKDRLDGYMLGARERLYETGFSSVEVMLQQRVRGVARDILAEAERGYAAVVLTRRGMGQLAGIPVGSVATKVLQKMSFTPVILIGEKIQTSRLLVAVDGSHDAMRAVSYVGQMLGSGRHEVELFHVIRSLPDAGPEDPMFMMSDVCSENARRNMEQMFETMKGQLVENGMNGGQVSGKILTGAVSRAGAILEEAGKGSYDTIVLGRKGLSRVQDFFMGRVSNKVVQAGSGFVLWMV